jgi:hypothetical protein
MACAGAGASAPSSGRFSVALDAVVASVAVGVGLAVLGGAIAVALPLAAALVRARPKEPQRRPWRASHSAQARGLVVLAGVLVVIGGVATLVISQASDHQGGSVTVQPGGAHAAREPAPRSEPPTAWAWTAGTTGVVALAALVVVARRRRPRPGREWTRATGAGGLHEREPWPADARLAVLAAYGRTERALHDHGLGRAPAEGPREFLERIRAHASVDADAADRLTSIYELARFSAHTTDESMRAEALAAHDRLRGDRA